MIDEAAQMAKDMYGPNGVRVCEWITMIHDARDLVQQMAVICQLQNVLASTREQTLRYAENNNLVPQMNRAVTDLADAYGENVSDEKMALYDTLVFITEAMVVAHCWEV